jgi:hypothetical protein
MSEVNQEALNKAMEELDELEKSAQEDPKDELDELTKSLEEELGEDLSKACECDDEKDDEKENKKEEEKEEGAEAKPLDKSQDDAYDDELVKASEAFDDLRKSVFGISDGLTAEMELLKKSLATLLNLNIKQAKAIINMAKSREEDSVQLAKSLSVLGARPVMPNAAKIGIGSTQEGELLQKSVSEVRELLIKAVGEGTVEARWLSVFDRVKNTDIFTDDIKTKIGL